MVKDAAKYFFSCLISAEILFVEKLKPETKISFSNVMKENNLGLTPEQIL